MRTLLRLTTVALLMGLLSASAAQAKTRIYVRIGPPPIIVERAVAAPGPGYVWVAGHQQWNGARYVWVQGTWTRPPHAHAQWVAGRWVHERRGYYWREGGWRR
ncbi:MAG TPA: YXWGXW repeat-containing protein [Thermoanaerobaculia bacterium]|jgi:hypothetical protein|nr:YXWGXW repeat-containing protein [Thermoanaerobaculia bacterium]